MAGLPIGAARTRAGWQVLNRTVSMRMLLIAVLVALAAGGTATYAATYLQELQPPAFRLVNLGTTGPCEGPSGYATSCPFNVVLRNDGGTGTALVVLRSNAYNALTDQMQTVTCTNAVPRTNHGDVVEVPCSIVAGPNRWIRSVPTVEIQN